MSSEGSVTSRSSRIRQFGLYRTIDARTDEFLRSSRKRQIRQGCACAAISTAITVTVVVSVILVYEYSINSESNVNKKNSKLPNFLGLMNESDLTQIDSKFTKKINLDRTTLKLLPILLKALNKNRHLEKILEDYSSSSPPYENAEETENYVKKNIFSDANNWLKIPSSKVYTLDYKTTPLIYIKRPSQQSDYLSRIRKIRNYERMLNYFDKMINDKVVYSKSSQNLKIDYEYTENPLKAVTIPKKTNKSKATEHTPAHHEALKKQNVTKNITGKVPKLQCKIEKKENSCCKCPKDMGQLLNKLIQSLQDLVPHPKIEQICQNKIRAHIQENQTLIARSTTQTTTSTKQAFLAESVTTGLTTDTTIQGFITKPFIIEVDAEPTTQKVLAEVEAREITMEPRNQTIKETTINPSTFITTDTAGKTTQLTTFVQNIPEATTANISLHSSVSTILTEKPTTTSEKNPETTTNTEKNTEQQNQFLENSILRSTSSLGSIPMYENYDAKITNYETNTNVNAPYTQTNTIDIATTEKIRPTTELIVPLKVIELNQALASTENLLESMVILPNYKQSIPLFKDEDYDEYSFSMSKTPNELDEFSSHSYDQIKTTKVSGTVIPNKIEKTKFKTDMRKIGLKSKPANNHPVIRSKEVDLLNMRKMPNSYEESTFNPVSVPTYETEGYMNTNSIENNTSSSNNIGFEKNIITTKMSTKKDVRSTQATLTGNTENTGEDEFQDEWLKQTEQTESPVNYKKPSVPYSEDEKQTTAQYELDRTKLEDKIITASVNSMLPPSRPVYLEIRRNNEWKPEEHATDYDINLTNNVFDLQK